jgi:hypothetical protein
MIGPDATELDRRVAGKPRSEKAPHKRLNRAVRAGEAIRGALDPALKRRGFASRDILTHWRAMAPSPYDAVALPDRLVWPRNAPNAVGATLYLRCAGGHHLALVHEAPRIAAAINRYFGYVLVDQIKLAITPFTPGSAAPAPAAPEVDGAIRAAIDRTVAGVGDPRVREALAQLGLALAKPKR